VKLLDTGEIVDVPAKSIFNDDTSLDDDRNHLILEVELLPTSDELCTLTAYKMLNEEDAERFISRRSYLRLIEIGRRGILCMEWLEPTPAMNAHEYTDRHTARSQALLWFQADILSVLQSSSARTHEWFDRPMPPPTALSRTLRLSEANRYTYEPGVLFSPIGLLFTDFEVYVLDLKVDASLLLKISNTMADLMTSLFGRCQLRLSRASNDGTSKLFMDFNLPRTSDSTKVFTALFRVLGPVRIRLHKGKAQVDTAPFLVLS